MRAMATAATTFAAGSRESARAPSANLGPATVAGLVIAFAAIYLTASVSGRQASLFLVGVAAGLVLYQAAFGFTSSWREMVTDGRGEGIRAQMLMLALTTLVFFPVLARGQVFGQVVRGSISPVGVSVIVGAFLFGVGMQLGGGCASGTLYTAGGGNTRMLVTLAAFIAGSVIGTAHMPWWSATPAFKATSLVTTAGLVPGLAISLTLFGLITLATIAIERRRRGQIDGGTLRRPRRMHVLGGPWPLAAGAIGLALVNIATLFISGRPWGVTGAFALWGAKALDAAGVNVQAWPYWAAPAQTAALRGRIAADITSVMDIGIVLGAMAAAGLAGRFAPSWRLSARSALTAAIGGLLLGYGARIAYGCNIGAYFSGIASGSAHGWLWLVAAFTGSAAGTRLRTTLEPGQT